MTQAPESPPPLVRNPRYGLLDACRGLACLMVVVFHASFSIYPDAKGDIWRRGLATVLRHGDLGVPIFFVISGYCIAASSDATRRRGKSPWRFLWRRVWRIYPPYWSAVGWFLLVTVGLKQIGLVRLLYGHSPYGLELIPPDSLSPMQWLGNLTLTETWRHLFIGPYANIFTRVAWSLCYEEQFYFLTFFLLLVFRRRLYGALAIASLMIVLVRVAAEDIGAMSRIDGLLFNLWHEFAVGLAVYWRLNLPMPWWTKRGVELLLAALCVLGLTVPMANTPVDGSTAMASAFGLFLIAVRDWDDWLGTSRWLQPLRACGRRSYSIYLCHLPVCTVGCFGLYELGIQGFWTRVFVTIPLVSASAVAFCWAFFHVFERPFLNPPIVGPSTAKPSKPEVPVTGEQPTASTSNLSR